MDREPQLADPDNVNRLVTAAFAGIKSEITGTSASDVVSACLTMTKMAIEIVLEMSDPQDLERNRRQLRDKVEVLLLSTLTRETPRA